MQVVINVSDDKFDSLVKDQIAALDPKELQGALTEAIKNYFVSDRASLEKLIFNKCSYQGYELSDSFKQVIANLDYSQLQVVVDKCVDELKTHYRYMLRDIIMENLSKQLIQTYSFREILSATITEELFRHMNKE